MNERIASDLYDGIIRFTNMGAFKVNGCANYNTVHVKSVNQMAIVTDIPEHGMKSFIRIWSNAHRYVTRGWSINNQNANEIYIIEVHYDVTRKKYVYLFHLIDKLTRTIKIKIQLCLSRPRIEFSISNNNNVVNMTESLRQGLFKLSRSLCKLDTSIDDFQILNDGVNIPLNIDRLMKSKMEMMCDARVYIECNQLITALNISGYQHFAKIVSDFGVKFEDKAKIIFRISRQVEDMEV